MESRAKAKILTLVLLSVTAISMGCSGVSGQPSLPEQSVSPPFAGDIVLTKGTPIFVRLQQSISTATAEPGRTFSAVLDEPLVMNGRKIAPEGATVVGCVIATRKSGRLHDAGYLRLTLSALTVNGKELHIQTNSVFVEGGSYKHRNLAYMGGGTTSSTLASALTGGNLFTGSMVGGNGDTSPAYITEQKEVGFAAGRRIGFRLIEPLNIPTTED
jgi:hypothetical protein